MVLFCALLVARTFVCMADIHTVPVLLAAEGSAIPLLWLAWPWVWAYGMALPWALWAPRGTCAVEMVTYCGGGNVEGETLLVVVDASACSSGLWLLVT